MTDIKLNSLSVFTTAQVAQKTFPAFAMRNITFTTAQVAQKLSASASVCSSSFTTAQVAQKRKEMQAT